MTETGSTVERQLRTERTLREIAERERDKAQDRLYAAQKREGALLAVVEAAQELDEIWQRFKEISPEPPSDTYRMDTQLALTAALDAQEEALAALQEKSDG